jgi:homoserine kinase
VPGAAFFAKERFGSGKAPEPGPTLSCVRRLYNHEEYVLHPSLRIHVAASTSNLGPGFDLLGLALSLFLRAEANAVPGPLQLVCEGSCQTEWAAIGENLLLSSYAEGARAFGAPGGGLRITVRSDIPVGRGLGSSAAAIVAGLLLARARAPRVVSPEEVFTLATAIEGHPDNVAPALYGGFCLCAPGSAGEQPIVLHPPLHPDLGFALAWPRTAVPTRAARAVLPSQVPFAHAIANLRHLALLLEGLRTARADLLARGSQDHLHVPFRKPLIPGCEQALEAAHSRGAFLATISGSGSALLAIGPKQRSSAIAEAMAEVFRQADGEGFARVVEPVHRAAVSEP